MRTTVTIDDHLLSEAKALAARQHRTLGEVIDDSLRATLNRPAADSPPWTLATFPGRLDIDLLDKEGLAEVLGDNEWPRRNDADL